MLPGVQLDPPETDLARKLEHKDAAQRQKAAQIVVNDPPAY